MTYDFKYYDLAIHFLEDHFDKVPMRVAQELAEIIQKVAEDFIEYDLGKNK